MAELAALHGSLRVPTAEEIEKWGALEYHCALCQDPIFTSDFEQDEDQPERKPIAVCYPVPEEYQPEFGDATQVAVCLRANAACTTKYKKKLDKGGMLVQAAPGILCEGARKALPSNKSVVQLLKGEIDLRKEVVEPEPETLVPPAGESAATPAEPDDGIKRADKPPADMGAGAVDTDEVHPLASAASDDVGDSGLGESAAVAAAKTAKDSATDGAAPMAGLQPEADASPMAVGAGPVDTDGDKMLHPAKTSDVGGGGAESGGGGDAAQTSIVMDYQDPDDSNINFETEVPAAMPPTCDWWHKAGADDDHQGFDRTRPHQGGRLSHTSADSRVAGAAGGRRRCCGDGPGPRCWHHARAPCRCCRHEGKGKAQSGVVRGGSDANSGPPQHEGPPPERRRAHQAGPLGAVLAG